jgi:tRNA threonylcarbamoyladenosine biosynthesis protein TsaB
VKPWLVLDTATPIAVVGVVDGARVLGEHRVSEPKRHAEGLIDAIDHALRAAAVSLDEIAGIGVGRGPGSFIGVRTGIATAKGLALGRSIPLVGLPTLLALAHSARDPDVVDGKGLAVIDAKRGEVYAQLVSLSAGVLRAIEEPRAMTPDDARKLGASSVPPRGASTSPRLPRTGSRARSPT